MGINGVLCNHLIWFILPKNFYLLPLQGLKDIPFQNCYEVISEEVFAVVLIRLSYPIQYGSMIYRFGHSQIWLSVVFNNTIFRIYRRFKQILEWDDRRPIFAKLFEFSFAIHAKGEEHCFGGFIDGNLNATCRLILYQQQFYSGHKQKHGYKYQLILTWYGLVASLMGLFYGRRGDWKIVELSSLQTKICAVNQGRRLA